MPLTRSRKNHIPFSPLIKEREDPLKTNDKLEWNSTHAVNSTIPFPVYTHDHPLTPLPITLKFPNVHTLHGTKLPGPLGASEGCVSSILLG